MNLQFLTVALVLALPISAQAGGPSAFNGQSFSALNERLQALENDGHVTAMVNGVEMKVNSAMPGYYEVITPTGVLVPVDENGYPTSSALYYASDDCTGTPYIRELALDEKKNPGESYTNPNLTDAVQIAYDGASVYYSRREDFVKLNFNSQYNVSYHKCFSFSGTDVAHRALPNDPAITGITSFPLLITGAGTPITISAEVGEKPVNDKIVYANGVRIGQASYIPTGPDVGIQVKLDAYPDEWIVLYKDGSYTGLSFGNQAVLYYPTADCSGMPYVRVLNDFDREWWDSTKTMEGPVVNNGDYYELSEEIYRMPPSGYKSRRYASFDACLQPNDSGKFGYKKAIQTAQPDLPVFTPPITVKGLADDTTYEALPVVE